MLRGSTRTRFLKFLLQLALLGAGLKPPAPVDEAGDETRSASPGLGSSDWMEARCPGAFAV